MNLRKIEGSSGKPLLNVESIRRDASQSMDLGAVTADYTLDVKLACDLLNEALAGEILCVLRYRHHQIAAKGIDFPQVAAEFKEHAESEEGHMLLIAERISQLGGVADFDPANVSSRAATQYGGAKDLLSMITEDLVAERVAIGVYRKLVDWFGSKDSTTRRMLEKILGDEEEHANDMADLLSVINRHQAS
jgi:bacterioferritin